MEIGVSTATFFGRAKTEDSLQLLKEVDARIIEIFLGSFYEYEEDFAHLLNKMKGDLVVHSVHTLNTHFEPQLFKIENERAYYDALKIYEKVLNSAKILGAKNYTMHGNMRFKKGTEFVRYAEYGKYFNILIELADKYNVDLCLENVEWAFYGKVGFFENVKKYAPKLKSCFDVKQARISGYPIIDYVQEMGESIKTVHLSDVDVNGKMCLPGKGVTDYKKLFEMLKNVGFNGNMFIEVYKENYKNLEELKESIEFLRNIKNEVFS